MPKTQKKEKIIPIMRNDIIFEREDTSFGIIRRVIGMFGFEKKDIIFVFVVKEISLLTKAGSPRTKAVSSKEDTIILRI